MEPAATGQPSQESSREVAPGSIDPNLRAGESASLGTSHLPQSNSVSDWSQPRQALNDMSLSYSDIEEDFETEIWNAPRRTRCTLEEIWFISTSFKVFFYVRIRQ
ncbi:hypothetical protein E4U34_003736 [Claviceps purpurea]|nr:hypothetical protein E4U36_005094 [Claviceps purpurea]KAG6219126.1 hypothetical protein E4U34_003736 [Claviceps purpurea]